MRTMLCLAILCAACGDDDGGGGTDAGVDSGETPDSAMVDSGVEDAPADVSPDVPVDSGPPPECPTGMALLDALEGDAPAFAVVGSDFTSTSIAVLDEGGGVVASGWIDSGVTDPGLVAALGGDVVLPGPVGGTVGLLDRLGADVATRLCFDGSLIGQLRLGPSEGFSTNPHDWIAVDANRAWATRYERNPDMDADDLAAGNDLFGFDPRTMTANGERIPLGSFDAMVSGLDGEGSAADVEVSARPDLLVQVDGHVVVGLDRLPVNLFGDVRGHGEGTIVIVADDGTVTSHTLTDLANCGRVQVVPGTTDEVVVACNGYSNLGFGEPTGERATAGIIRLRIADGAATEIAGWRAADDDASIMAVNGVVSLGENRVVAVAAGNFGDTPDRLFEVDLQTGDQAMLAEAGGSFVLGQGAYNGTLVLLVPDATTGSESIRRFTVMDSTIEEGASVVVDPTLPPRAIRAL